MRNHFSPMQNMAPLTLYHSTASAHSRGALFTIRNLGLDVDVSTMEVCMNSDIIHEKSFRLRSDKTTESACERATQPRFRQN